jgi:hypothetical protein
MWYAAVVMCGLSGPAPCIVRIENATYETRAQCRRRTRELAGIHGLPPGALRSKRALEGSASARNLGALPFFNLGCVAFTPQDFADGTPLMEKAARTLGPRSGAEL